MNIWLIISLSVLGGFFVLLSLIYLILWWRVRKYEKDLAKK